MGYSISWLATRGKSPEAIQEKLGLSGTGELADYADAPIVGRRLPSGWYLLVAKGCDHQIISDRVLAAASSGCSLVACSIEEHVMFCSSACWENGKTVWRVGHRAETALFDLSVSGEPPAAFDEIRGTCAARQEAEGGERAGVDWFFDIPLQLARHVVGFKHDEQTPGVEAGSFEVLRVGGGGLISPAARPWWRFW